MPNHYHLLLETLLGNLSRAMRHINGVYTQRFNRQCRKDSHLFRGRYKAILVEDDAYLVELAQPDARLGRKEMACAPAA